MDLVVERISHRYGSLTALEDVDFSVRAGEILALIGPSGCGKSTLLHIMGGILKPTSGRMMVRGTPPSDSFNPYTYIFQDFALLPWRTVEGNVSLAIEHHSLPHVARQELIADALARTRLTEFRRAYPRQLSGGMRQRVGIARALIVRPAVLLMDEPFSALDAQTREFLIEDFLALWARERTTIAYVTHNLLEALRLADRIVIFSRRPGRVREVVSIEIPQAQRATPAGRMKLLELQDRLSVTLRAEAQDTDRAIVSRRNRYG
jgi:NitT/TauT family transport system ATP-binding protein